MNDNLIERIIEMEKKANRIIETATSEEKDFNNAVSERKKHISDKYDKLLYDTVAKAKSEAMSENQAEIEKLKKNIELKKSVLKKKYDDNSEKWVNSLFEEILR